MNGAFKLFTHGASSFLPRSMGIKFPVRSIAQMSTATIRVPANITARQSVLQNTQFIRPAPFATSNQLWSQRFYSSKKCKKAEGMPCQRRDLTLTKVPEYNDRKKCPKICLPCCSPARDPPSCVKALGLEKCTPIPPPYICYVQCMNVPEPDIDCECRYPMPAPCVPDGKKSNNDDKPDRCWRYKSVTGKASTDSKI